MNRTQAQDISKESYSRLFALCSQETIVFSNSLFEEIGIACPGADLAQVRSAAEAAGLSGSSGSLNRWIGDRGVRFSGGQRQMIAIARALLRKPQVLILDEAMTGLDIHTADMIWHNIRSILPDTAILAVSHNWDIIRRCQRVLVLANGHIVKSIHVDDIDDTERFFRDFHIAPEK